MPSSAWGSAYLGTGEERLAKKGRWCGAVRLSGGAWVSPTARSPAGLAELVGLAALGSAHAPPSALSSAPLCPPLSLPFSSSTSCAAAAARPRQFRPTGLPSPALSPRCPGPERSAAGRSPRCGGHTIAPSARQPRAGVTGVACGVQSTRELPQTVQDVSGREGGGGVRSRNAICQHVRVPG